MASCFRRRAIYVAAQVASFEHHCSRGVREPWRSVVFDTPPSFVLIPLDIFMGSLFPFCKDNLPYLVVSCFSDFSSACKPVNPQPFRASIDGFLLP